MCGKRAGPWVWSLWVADAQTRSAPQAAPLWTSAAIAAATGGRLVGEPFEVAGVGIDSRTSEAGELFVALAGARKVYGLNNAVNGPL